MIKRVCLFEDVESTFNFGRYHGLSLTDVMDINPSYVAWCLKLCTGVNFVITNNTITQLEAIYPFLKQTSFRKLCKKREEDYEFWLTVEDDYDIDEHFDNKNWDDSYSETYERYNGSYAQDEMGYSDDEIDTIFDGDPLAYWNID